MTDDDAAVARFRALVAKRLTELGLPEEYLPDPDAPSSAEIMLALDPFERARKLANLPAYQQAVLDRISEVVVKDGGEVEFIFRGRPKR